MTQWQFSQFLFNLHTLNILTNFSSLTLVKFVKLINFGVIGFVLSGIQYFSVQVLGKRTDFSSLTSCLNNIWNSR